MLFARVSKTTYVRAMFRAELSVVENGIGFSWSWKELLAAFLAMPFFITAFPVGIVFACEVVFAPLASALIRAEFSGVFPSRNYLKLTLTIFACYFYCHASNYSTNSAPTSRANIVNDIR